MKVCINAVLILYALNSCAQMPANLTSAEKVFGLSKFWQEVNYNFVYFYKVDKKKWDSTYVSLIDRVQQTKNDYEYYKLLQQFCATLRDGHTSINLPKDIQSKLMRTMFGDYRIFIENIDHKAIITHVNPSKINKIPIGSEIIAVNIIPTKVYLTKYILPYISSSSDHVLEDMAITEMLQGFPGDEYVLTIKNLDGKVFKLSVKHEKCSETQLFPPLTQTQEILELKWMSNQVAYLALNSFQDQAINSMFIKQLPALSKAKACIIDLRKNGGGDEDIGLEILKYFIPNDTILGSRSRTRNHIATYMAWGEMTALQDTILSTEHCKAYLNYIGEYYYNFPITPRYLETETKRIIVPVVVLIGHETASAAEDFLIYADKQRHFTTIGCPTFGSTGQPFHFTLPGGGQARVCTKQDTYPDGREFVGKGIMPDILVERTLDDFLSGKDPALEKALTFINNLLTK